MNPTTNRARGIGGDIAPRRVVRPQPPRPVALPLPSSPPSSARRSRTRTRPRVRRRGKLLEALQYPLIALVALGAAYNTTWGQLLVLGYVAAALWWRRGSRLSFAAALFMLATIPLFQVIGQSSIAQNAALYVYELLVFGTAQAIWEQYKIDKTAN